MVSPDEVWLLDFGDPYPGEPAHHRPALVVGPPPEYGSGFPFVFVVPATTRRRGLSLHVEVEPTEQNGLDATSYLQCELLRSVSTKRLVDRIGTVDAAVHSDVERILRGLLRHW